MIVLGKNVVVSIYNGGVWTLYGCARNCTLTISTETIDISSTGTGDWQSVLPTKHSGNLAIDGIVNLETDGLLSLADLRQRQVAKEKLRVQYERTDSADNTYVDDFYCYIVNSTDSGSVNDLNLFNIECQISGSVNQSFTPTPQILPKVYTYTYTATGGESSFTVPSLENKDIIGVYKDGVRFEILLGGVAVGKQVVYDDATGEFDFGLDFEDGEIIQIDYQNL